MTTNQTSIFEFGIIAILTFVYLMTPADGVLNDTLVTTRFGQVRGIKADDGDYYMFMGVPYARVNLTNPFGASIPIANFNETFDAFDDAIACPQQEEFNNTIIGNIDCLRLNIYAPAQANKLPVLLYIFGGQYNFGFPSRHLYGPKFLVKHDIILVFINYRLGPYGFLCLDTPEVPGNQGFKDQLTAMRWVRQNIEVFGGDPSKITICGHSSGAQSVDLHVRSNKERLFRNVILQSGSAFVPPTEIKSDISMPIKMAAYLGFDTDVLNDALKFLTGSNPKTVIKAAVALDFKSGLCVEKKFVGVENFMTKHPLYSKLEDVNNINILLGFTNNEVGMIFLNKSDQYFKNTNFLYEKLSDEFDFGNSTHAEDTVKSYYLGDKEYGLDSRKEIIDFGSDFLFVAPMQRCLRKYLRDGAKSVFMYMFKYAGLRNYVKILKNDTSSPNAYHGDELGYLFNGNYLKHIPMTDDDHLMIDRMTMMWSNFVKYGDPTPSTTDLLPVRWPPATIYKQNYLTIDTNMAIGSRPFHDRMTFWQIFYELYKEYQWEHIYACEDRSIECTRKNDCRINEK